jgi:hypothetical protein
MEATNDPQKIGQALAWIVGLLKRHNLPYQIVGGLAAKAYGAKRPLVDIDIYAPLENAQAMLDELRPYVVRELLPHHSESWDLIYMALDYHGMPIEIGDSSATPRFYNRRDQRWEDQLIHYADSNIMTIYGVEVAVMPKDELLAYKAMLDRDVDHVDIQEIAAAS